MICLCNCRVLLLLIFIVYQICKTLNSDAKPANTEDMAIIDYGVKFTAKTDIKVLYRYWDIDFLPYRLNVVILNHVP